MKASVDATKCEAYGVCVDLCPSVFQLDEWGYASLIGDGTVAAGDQAAAREAVAACPEDALSVVD